MPKRTKRRSAGNNPSESAVPPESEVPEASDNTDDDQTSDQGLGPSDAAEIVGTATRELAPAPAPDGALVPRDALSAYMAEIRRYPVLSREEEHELALKYYEDGDEEAAYKLITANLRLVVIVAREYQRAFHNLLDLIQEGNIGLLEAVKKFDPYKGVRLPSYAVWWIRAYVIRYVMNNFRLVKVGTTQAQRRLFFNLQKEKARLEAEGFSPDPKTIADNLGVSEKEVIEMDQRMSISSEVSADAPVGAEGDTRMLDLIPNDDATAENEFAENEFYGLMRGKLESFRDTLEGRDREIFDERMLAEEPLTLVELGERYGVSRERVRQLEERVRSRLRDFLVDEVHDLDPAMFDS